MKRSPQGRDLWKAPVEGGEESQVLESIGSLAIWDQGIYFLQNDALYSLSFESGEIQEIAEVDLLRFNTVSSDGRWILYGQIDQHESDLMLVDNFR